MAKKPQTAAISHPRQRKEQIALVQFVAWFDEFKKEGSEWLTFSNRHEYWDKAAAFVLETAGTEFQRSGKSSSKSYLANFQRGLKFINEILLVNRLFLLCSKEQINLFIKKKL